MNLPCVIAWILYGRSAPGSGAENFGITVGVDTDAGGALILRSGVGDGDGDGDGGGVGGERDAGDVGVSGAACVGERIGVGECGVGELLLIGSAMVGAACVGEWIGVGECGGDGGLLPSASGMVGVECDGGSGAGSAVAGS